MSLWSRLFRSSAARGGVGAASQVPRLAAPTIGFLNLTGDNTQVDADRVRLAPLFARAPTSTGDVPACDVLFLYASVDAEGGIVGSPLRLRDLVRSAGARIAVLASENPPDHCLNALEPANGWPANLVLVVDRKGTNFAAFFLRLFASMARGESILVAWAGLAPQIPGHVHPDCPETILLPEAGHITFDGTGSSPGG